MGPHNIHSLPDQSLVRLRGTVQDLPNPELYLGVAKLPDGSLITTKFTDGVDARLASSEQVALWDRKPIVLVAPPCSPWVAGGSTAAAAGPEGAAVATVPSADEVLVYLYDEQGGDLCLHDLVEVVGILSKEEHATAAGGDDLDFEEDQDPFAESRAFAKVWDLHGNPREKVLVVGVPTGSSCQNG